MSQKQQRLLAVLAVAILLGGAIWLTLSALRDNIVFFFTPSEITMASQGKVIRLGGLVKEDSVKIIGVSANFIVTDGEADIAVSFEGALPSLFREGQGVVAEGRFTDGKLHASNVLAKHDETYMPREVAETLRDKGVWQGSGK